MKLPVGDLLLLPGGSKKKKQNKDDDNETAAVIGGRLRELRRLFRLAKAAFTPCL